MSAVVDMGGEVYGMLAVLHRDRSRMGGKAYWTCRCECGVVKSICGAEMRNGTQKSCGCAQTFAASRSRITHGKSRTALHRLWRNMINRCEREQTHNYNRYGGRGINVCEEWRSNAALFIGWCEANGWSSGLEIDRINNDEGYFPGNCRFVTRAENARNRSGVRSAARSSFRKSQRPL